MATCLSIVQTVCGRLGLSQPSIVIGSQDLQITTLLAICNEEGQELAARTNWTDLQTETTFTTLATEDQGALATIAPGMKFIVNDTIWNRSLRRPVYGPRSEQAWQQQKAFSLNGPWSGYRIKNGRISMYPVPVAGQTCAFEYVSANWVANAAGTTFTDVFTADTDTPRQDYQIIQLGVLWRWKKLKGLEYAEDFNAYERRVQDYLARDGGKDWLSTVGARYDIQPVVMVASGSWNL